MCRPRNNLLWLFEAKLIFQYIWTIEAKEIFMIQIKLGIFNWLEPFFLLSLVAQGSIRLQLPRSNMVSFWRMEEHKDNQRIWARWRYFALMKIIAKQVFFSRVHWIDLYFYNGPSQMTLLAQPGSLISRCQTLERQKHQSILTG